MIDVFFVFKQKTAYEMRISDWSSDVWLFRSDALLRPALFLVAPRAAEGDVEAVEVERLLQSLGLPHVGVQGAMVEGIDPARLRLGVLVDDEVHAAFGRHAVAQLVHRLELPRRDRKSTRLNSSH